MIDPSPADHVQSGTPVVLEDDFLLPDPRIEFGEAVRAMVVSDSLDRVDDALRR